LWEDEPPLAEEFDEYWPKAEKVVESVEWKAS
jgi:hypothetical protein